MSSFLDYRNYLRSFLVTETIFLFLFSNPQPLDEKDCLIIAIQQELRHTTENKSEHTNCGI